MAVPPNRFTDREITYETNVNLDTFRNTELSGRSIRILDQSFLRPVLNLPDIAFPRLVRAFYSSIRTDNWDDVGDKEYRINIDGQRFTFTLGVLAAAIGLQNWRLGVYGVPEFQMIADLAADRIRDSDPEKVVRQSYLEPDLWLLDRVIKETIYPIGHEHQRRDPLLSYLHAACRGEYVDVPQLMMHAVRIVRADKRKKCYKLAYPRYITALLSHLGYVFSEGEEEKRDFDTLTLSQWTSSIKRLKLASKYVEPGGASTSRRQRRRIEEQPEEQAEPEQHDTAPQFAQQHVPEQPFHMTQAQYDALLAYQQESRDHWSETQRRLTAIEQHQQQEAERHAHCFQMQSMMRSLCEFQMPADVAQRTFALAQAAADAQFFVPPHPPSSGYDPDDPSLRYPYPPPPDF